MNDLSLADEPVTSKCIHCGADISPKAKFCEECGFSQAQGENASQSVALPKPPKPRVDYVMRILLSVAVVILGTIASLLALQTFNHPPDKWQYTVIAPSDADLEKVLNNDGADGWEVVSTRRASSGEGANSTFSYELILKKRGSQRSEAK
jgi:ribosomal protein L40E